MLTVLVGLISCKSNPDKEGIDGATSAKDSLTYVETNDLKLIENYNKAKEIYAKNSNDPDAIIWFGRRTAYLGKYEEAITIYSEGIMKHPEDARMYRHRGHRYISLRQFDKAIADLTTAVGLIEDQKDQVEPDGLPNSKNIPLSTLHGNIWYHLGLAYYLKNDLDNALHAFSNRSVTERYDDNVVSGGYWKYMILRRMGKKAEADAAIQEVNAAMDIIENMSYYKLCLFYKQLINEAELTPDGSSDSANDVFSYGLGNWYLYHEKDTLSAKKHFQHLLEKGNKFSFAYIAAESDWNRIFKK